MALPIIIRANTISELVRFLQMFITTVDDYLYGGELKVPNSGRGLVMINAAGTVTKRVRLNDAGDGLVYEDE